MEDAAFVHEPVLCVDLDGTLINSDLVWECVLRLLRDRPWRLLLLPLWLMRGRASFKRSLAEQACLQVSTLPYRSEILSFIKAEQDSGRSVVLVTAADSGIAEQVSRHLGLFDQVCASDGKTNLKGSCKAKFLCERFGERRFDYLGDSLTDLEVWKAARAAYVVGDEALGNRASAVAEVKRVFGSKNGSFRTWGRALRGKHWAKNLLLFLPLLLAHSRDASSFVRTAVGFLLWGICASGLYVVNDLLDLHSDRDHPWKRTRPFAAGEIPIWEGLLVSAVLLASSLLGSFALSPRFAAVLLTYVLLTMLYSVWLKRVVLLDAFVLSSFYVIRIEAGGLLTDVPLSHWLITFSLFFFLSLSMAKRYSELLMTENLLKDGKSGRGYLTGDRELLLALGVASAFSAVVVFTLYVHSAEVIRLYRRPEILLLLAPILLYWLSRIWLQAHRGELDEDPVTLALRDRTSYGVALIGIAVLLTAALLPA